MKLHVIALLMAMPLLLAKCEPIPPRLFVSPREATVTQATLKLYMPFALNTPNKAGIAGGNAAMAQTLGASWWYVWGPEPEAGGVPMIWGRAQARAQIAGEVALLFNEPDACPNQACMTPGEAAVLTWQLRAAHPNVQWGCPAVTQRPAGLSWLDQYFKTYSCLYGETARPCEFLTAHCYLDTARACTELLEREYKPRMDRLGIAELWVTEFYFAAETEARAFTTWLDQTPWVTRWSPFVSRINCDAERQFWDCAAAGNPSLFDATGRLTRIGRWYERVWE